MPKRRPRITPTRAIVRPQPKLYLIKNDREMVCEVTRGGCGRVHPWLTHHCVPAAFMLHETELDKAKDPFRGLYVLAETSGEKKYVEVKAKGAT